MWKMKLLCLTLLGMLCLHGCSSAQLASVSEAFDCADPLSIKCTVSRQRANEERRKADEYRRDQERYEREYAEYLDCLNGREEDVLNGLEEDSLEEDVRIRNELEAFEARRKELWGDVINELEEDSVEEDTNCYEPYEPIEPYYSYY